MAAIDSPPPAQPFRLQEQDLRGKVALVTGATKGIGRAICIELATRGADILGTYSSDDSKAIFEELSREITTAYVAHYDFHRNDNLPDPQLRLPVISGIKADIRDRDSEAVIREILVHVDCDFGNKIDIVVFNAAVMTLSRMGEGSVRQDSVDLALIGNIRFPVMLVELFVTQGIFRKNGRVVAISSEGVRAKRPAGGAVYAATKAAIECLMRKWADELGKRPGMEGTTFNSVSVGFTKTEAYNRIPPEARARIEASDAAEVTVGSRIGEAEDIAGVVGLLVSEKARWISGSVVDASGGKAKII